MRIGFDATVLAPGTRLTGGGEYAAHLLRALAATDRDDSYVLYGPPGMTRPGDIPGSMEWRQLSRGRFGKLSALYNHLFNLPRQVRGDRIDVFHAPTVHTRPSMPPAPRGLGCPIVVTVHDLIPITFYEANGQALPLRMRTFYKWNLRRALRADHIITVSETSKAEIVRFAGIPGERVSAIYNGAGRPCTTGDEEKSLNRLGVRRPFILFVGSWEPRKNLRRLLEGFDSAGRDGLDADLVLIVERESGHAAEILRYARTLGCHDRLTFLHSISDSDVWALYRQAEMLAYPSLYEGFGLPPVQAMTCGTPVVSSPNGALREVLGEAALYIDPLEPGSIATGLLEVSRDAGLRRRLSQAGIEQARRYSWEETARQTAAVYHALAGKAEHEA
ncbi:MAG: glycosyltransferase family 1 protein [Dehalococcoidia bacterium]|nr:glycosyltransferase family 1 protein [Dehalococcoidia bacterium]